MNAVVVYDKQMEEKTLALLDERGVKLEDIAEIVYQIQIDYLPDLNLERCLSSVKAVLAKREVQHVVLTGIALDKLAEEHKIPEPLGELLRTDDFLYGVDEVIALGISNIYGSIGVTNFGYLDKVKIGVIEQINDKKRSGEQVNTFLDDLVASIAAAAAARLAHEAGYGHSRD